MKPDLTCYHNSFLPLKNFVCSPEKTTTTTATTTTTKKTLVHFSSDLKLKKTTKKKVPYIRRWMLIKCKTFNTPLYPRMTTD